MVIDLVSEMHDNVDLVLGIRSICELECIPNSRESWFSFLHRVIPFFLKGKVILNQMNTDLLR